ncbi:Septin-type guanine nucleotide-binding (G) domain-containing protein [Zychaea mexicana]|uniref:Septin-type guanine nucleotide-binding (G) domain-containing protein n=1 Tax=Zychaea mexicana TaxID=64656 RepID=UPI0022FE1146|nr:Septin-type guanine nucleotide-binding (G) domain-containing protein [Zychaea mexicana]KAI9496066.1 Septin-type guanine nucleotide-binding (G) domain-containing protein [Zychaea mexicana]
MLYNAYSQKLSGQQTARSRKEPISYFNVMVAGQAGTGKTMFVRTLCERLKCNIIQGTLEESRPMVLKEQLRATEDFYSVSMHVEEDGERISFTLIDTPGFDDGLAIDHQLRYVAKYIDHQFERTLIEETKVKRDTKALDTQIHACLYFLDTMDNCLSDTDRYALRVLSSRVNVIPIIGKADTLTVCQRENLKKGFRNDIFDALQIPIYGFIDLEDDQEDEASNGQALERGSLTMTCILEMLRECVDEDDDEDARTMIGYLEQMPYTTFGYEEDPDTGRPVPLTPRETQHILGRRYPWAVVECSNPDHCDFEKIRSMIVTDHRDMLRIDTFERFYEKYRTEQLLSRRVNRLMATEVKNGKVLA